MTPMNGGLAGLLGGGAGGGGMDQGGMGQGVGPGAGGYGGGGEDPSTWSSDADFETARKVSPKGAQLQLDERELLALAHRIEEDCANSFQAHDTLRNKFERYETDWRRRVGGPGGEYGKSNFKVPMTRWQLWAKWAKEVESLFGEDAEVVAVPVAPTDVKRVAKVGRFMTWMMFSAMKMVVRLAEFDFRKLLNGRAIARCVYTQKYYNHPTKGRVLYYEGPDFEPLMPDEFITPPEDNIRSLQDFSFVIHSYRATPEQLLRDEREGELYQGIEENWDAILRAARTDTARDVDETIKTERDAAEGVDRQDIEARAPALRVLAWYGKWRMKKNQTGGGATTEVAEQVQPAYPNQSLNDTQTPHTIQTKVTQTTYPEQTPATGNVIDERELEETDLVVRYSPSMHKVIGAQRLDELYPDTPNKRPFVSSGLVKDGSFWCPGLPEILEDIEMEATVNHNLVTEAGQYTVGPLIFYRPGSGADPDARPFKYEPGLAIPCDDPQGDVRVINLTANLEYAVMQQQNLFAMAERLIGQSDMALGRTIDRPNAPRTARGTLALIEQGEIRVALDTRMLREDIGEIAGWIWDLCSMFMPNETFFRVTEEQAKGLFDVAQGFGKLTAEEREGRYDFSIKLATGAHSREAEKQDALELATIALQAPLVAQDPRAQWNVLASLYKSHGKDFRQIQPTPPPQLWPLDPIEEWNLALQGDEFHVNELDNDRYHLADHEKRIIAEGRRGPDQDVDAIHAMVLHIQEHEKAMVVKMKQMADAAALQTAVQGALETRMREQAMEGQNGAAAPSGAGPQKATNGSKPPQRAPKIKARPKPRNDQGGLGTTAENESPFGQTPPGMMT